MRFRALFASIISLFCVELLAQKGPEATPEDGTLVFMEGIALSYASHHAAAEEKFEAYRKTHPDDLLAYLRTCYDRFFGARGEKFSRDEYPALLGIVTEAIAKYEAKGCAGTDIRSIAGDTLDCAYVGAALYSFRMTLAGKYDSWFKVGKDRDKFLSCANQSRSLQAQFLLGLYEYEPSVQSWPIRTALRHFGRVPTDHAHAVATVLQSLDGNAGPFVDDIWFFVFDAECRYDGADFMKKYPLTQVFGYLRAKYPDNSKIKNFHH